MISLSISAISTTSNTISTDNSSTINGLKQQELAIEKQINDLNSQSSTSTSDKTLLKNLETQKTELEKEIAALQSSSTSSTSTATKAAPPKEEPPKDNTDAALNAKFGPAYTTEISQAGIEEQTKAKDKKDKVLTGTTL